MVSGNVLVMSCVNLMEFLWLTVDGHHDAQMMSAQAYYGLVPPEFVQPASDHDLR